MKVVTTLLDLGVRGLHISTGEGGKAVHRALSTKISPFTRWTEAKVGALGAAGGAQCSPCCCPVCCCAAFRLPFYPPSHARRRLQVPYAGEVVETLVGVLPNGEAVVFLLADHRSNRRFPTSATVGAAAELAAHSLAGGHPTLGDKERVLAACRCTPRFAEMDDETFEHWWVP